MKNIILFQPSVGYMDMMRTKPSLPLSLLHAASITGKYYDVRIIDQRIEQNWQGSLEKNITEDTVCAGVTGLTGAMLRQGINFQNMLKTSIAFLLYGEGFMLPYCQGRL